MRRTLKSYSLEYPIDKVLHDWSEWHISMLLNNDESLHRKLQINRLRE